MTRMTQLAIATAVLLAGAALNVACAQTSLPSSTQNRATIGHKLNQQIRAMDTNHDGRISKAEYDHYWKHQFKLADTNHDGRLSKAEFHAAAKRLNDGEVPSMRFLDQRWKVVNGHGPVTEKRYLAWLNDDFTRADTNADGYLTRKEFRWAMKANNGNVSSL